MREFAQQAREAIMLVTFERIVKDSPIGIGDFIRDVSTELGLRTGTLVHGLVEMRAGHTYLVFQEVGMEFGEVAEFLFDWAEWEEIKQ